MTAWLPYAALLCASIPAALTCWNLLFYRQPPTVPRGTALPACTVVIPARNEAAGIAACVESVLASTGITLDCVVMDDASTDETRAICQAIAEVDPRLRVVATPALPAGWNGKQHACWCGAQLSQNVNILFLDADVRLAPDALARMTAFLQSSQSALVSGIPLQQTGTLLEKMLLPLIHFLLLGFLPCIGLRNTNSAAYGAGCGQFLLVNRAHYFQTGGHSQIKLTMHDGLKLPRVFRNAGLHTDLADLTALATCRMYTSASQVWRGLSKNATEGMASPGNILPFTFLLFVGQVLPLPMLIAAKSTQAAHVAIAALLLSYLPRMLAAIRFRQSWLGVLLHPIDIALLLLLQWTALLRKLVGHQPVWKQRQYDAG